MLAAEPYNEIVRRHFFAPLHVGNLSRDYPHTLRASVEESDKGSRLVVAAGVADEIVVEMRFLAWGCPHLIAAADALCQDREQRAVAGLSVFALSELMELLAVPVEKTGRILLLEDALKSLWAQYTGAG